MFGKRATCLQVLLIAVLVGLFSACSAPTNAPTPSPALQQLRITNSGQEDIVGLVVLFPGPSDTSSATRVEFSDVAVGETTGYRDVPSGVYSYAAYEFVLDGQVITEPAIDWIGESPMAGRKFTYRLALDSQREPMMRIQLVEVLVDEL